VFSSGSLYHFGLFERNILVFELRSFITCLFVGVITVFIGLFFVSVFVVIITEIDYREVSLRDLLEKHKQPELFLDLFRFFGRSDLSLSMSIR